MTQPARGKQRRTPAIGRYLDVEEVRRLTRDVRGLLDAPVSRTELARVVGRDTASRRAATIDLMELLRAAKESAPDEDRIRLPEKVYAFQKRGSLNRVFAALGQNVHLRLRPRRSSAAGSGEEEPDRIFELYWIRGLEAVQQTDGRLRAEPVPVAMPDAVTVRPPRRAGWFGAAAAVIGAAILVGSLLASRPGGPFDTWPRTSDGRFVVLGPDRVQRVTDDAEMVRVPAGEFGMGLTPEEFDDLAEQLVAEGIPEKEARRNFRALTVHKGPYSCERLPVYLDEYWIDRYEVTNAQYLRFVRETGHRIPEHSIDPARLSIWEGYEYPPELDRHPVVNVSWLDAVAYCEWAGGYLPTSAQWEKAARGTDGRLYPWGDEWQRGLANTGKRVGDSRVSDPDGPWARTTPVGYFPSEGPYGTKDMAGNVGEWIRDWGGSLYLWTLDNPTGPATGNRKVFRGGTWLSVPGETRATSRRGKDAVGGYRDVIFGFRCAATIRELLRDDETVASMAAVPQP